MCNRFCYKWVRKQVSLHLKKHYLNTIKALWCFFFSFLLLSFFVTEENKQHSFCRSLQMLLLHCSHFICRTERSPCGALPTGERSLHLGELRAQIGGAETEGAGEEKWGPHVPPNITDHHFPVHLSVTEPCIDVAAGTSMALPKEDVQWMGWAGAAGTPGSWHPHRLWKDVSWLHYIPDTCCQGFEEHISFLSRYSGCSEKNVPFPPRMKVFREAKGLESIISLFVLSCLD